LPTQTPPAQYRVGDAQSPSTPHEVLHDVVSAQMNPPGQAAGAPYPQKVPAQLPGESLPALQDAGHWLDVEQAGTQRPEPLQIVPPLSLQAVPWVTFCAEHALLAQTLTLHAVCCFGQSAAVSQPTQYS
jgi:hypothetical protein